MAKFVLFLLVNCALLWDTVILVVYAKKTSYVDEAWTVRNLREKPSLPSECVGLLPSFATILSVSYLLCMYASVRMCVSLVRACRGSLVRACVVPGRVRVGEHTCVCMCKNICLYCIICVLRVGAHSH